MIELTTAAPVRGLRTQQHVHPVHLKSMSVL